MVVLLAGLQSLLHTDRYSPDVEEHADWPKKKIRSWFGQELFSNVFE